MDRRKRRSGLKIQHLALLVLASSFALALAKFPQQNALMLVSIAGFLMIGCCVGVAVIQALRDRRSKSGRADGLKAGEWAFVFGSVATMGLVADQLRRNPATVIPIVMAVVAVVLSCFAVLFVTWMVAAPTQSEERGPEFWRLVRRNLGMTVVVVAVSLLILVISVR